MKWFKSVWMKLRKSNGMPGNEVFIPMVEQNVSKVTEEIIVKPVRKPRKKKNATDR